jgi:protein lifeguard
MAGMFNFHRMEKETDIESGQPDALYPGMVESVDLRWAFIRKIYAILTVQLALTAAVAAVVVTVRPISHFFVSSNGGLALYIFLLVLPFISSVLLLLLFYFFLLVVTNN